MLAASVGPHGVQDGMRLINDVAALVGLTLPGRAYEYVPGVGHKELDVPAGWRPNGTHVLALRRRFQPVLGGRRFPPVLGGRCSLGLAAAGAGHACPGSTHPTFALACCASSPSLSSSAVPRTNPAA